MSLDFILGFIVTTLLLLNFHNRQLFLQNDTTILVANLALGIAILGVNLTALSILVAFLDDKYLKIIQKSKYQIKGTLRPYKIVATVATLASLFSLASLVVSPVVICQVAFVLFALSCGFTVWSIVGTLQIIRITAFHGLMKSRLDEIPEAVAQAIKISK